LRQFVDRQGISSDGVPKAEESDRRFRMARAAIDVLPFADKEISDDTADLVEGNVG
jgi:hypothetical protein